MSHLPTSVPAQIKTRIRRWRRFIAVTAMLLAVALVCDQIFPPPIPDVRREGATIVLARDGTPLRAFAASGGIWRYPVSVEDVSPLYVEALLGYEDRWFRTHPGINPLSMVRALAQAIQHGEVVSGGSTLTMQVARLIDPAPRSVSGKFRQMLRALQIERRLRKDRILELYLNLAPFGGTVQGVEAASWAYLGKPARQLSHSEAALLAVLPQAPSRLRPDRHAAAAQQARDKVLGRLELQQVWSTDQIASARQEIVAARRLRPPRSAALLAQRLHSALPGRRVIRTLIDASLQRELEEKVGNYIEPMPIQTSAAVIVLDNDDLGVRAYIGSGSFADPDRLGHVDMVRAHRSPGSTLKPFVYGMALEEGLIHSQSLLADVPQSFDGYRPANFADTFNGPVAAADALRLSLNVPAVDLLARVGPEAFASRLLNAGVHLRLPRGARPNLSLVLGGTATTLEELAGAYRALSHDGLAGSPRLLVDQPRIERRALSPGAAWIVRSILAAHVRPGDALLGLDLRQRPDLAWKTGTSFGFRDAWALGVTGKYTIGVWIGRPDGSPLPGHYGAITALPLLFAIADGMPGQHRQFGGRPAAVSQTEICWPLGLRASDTPAGACLRRQEAWLLDQVAPPTLAAFEDRSARPLLTSACAGSGESTAGVPLQVSWPARLAPWVPAPHRRRGTGTEDCGSGPSDSLSIDGLPANAELVRAPGGREPRIEVRALGASGTVDWLLDGKHVARLPAERTLRLSLAGTGERELLAIDAQSRFARLPFRLVPSSGR